MLNLLKQAWNDFTSGLSSIYHFILNTIATVYGYINRLFDSLSRYAVGVYRELETFAHNVNVWVTRTVSYIYAYIRSEATAIVHWVVGIYDDLRKYAIDVYQWAIKAYDYILNWVTTVVNAVVKWVIANIWQPLYNSIRSLFAWIEQYGVWLWDVVSNPEKLVAWLMRYLLSAWLYILRTWSAPIVSWLIQQAYRFIPDIVSLLEDVISKVL